MQEVEVFRLIQRQDQNVPIISLRIVAPTNQLDGSFHASPGRKSSAYLPSDRARQKERPTLLTPVTLVQEAAERWLMAPYGEVGWVRNARAAERLTLTRGRRFENVRILELSAEDAAPVLKKYLTQVPVVRPFFDVTPKSNLRDFAAEASRHPVFRIQ